MDVSSDLVDSQKVYDQPMPLLWRALGSDHRRPWLFSGVKAMGERVAAD